MANNIVGSNLKAPKKLSLKDLSLMDQSDVPTVQAFAPTPDQSAPVANLPSSANSAAYAAALSPDGTSADQMIDSYRQALSESTLEGQSTTATQIFQQAKQNAMQQNVDPLMGILSDPNIPDDQKRRAVEATYDQKSLMYSPQNILSTKALNTPTKSVQNNEQDDTRFNISSGTAEMNEVKNGIQQVYNSAQSAVQPDLAQHIYDLGVNLLPFTRQFMLAKIRADQSGAPVSAFVKTFLGGAGNTTQYLRDQIASLPPDQQVGAAESLANIINNHSNVVISKPDDEARRSFLQGVIGGEGYGDRSALADNISSWLDLTMFGGPLLKGVKSASKFAAAMKDGAKEADVAKAFQSDFDAHYTAEKQGQVPTPVDDAPEELPVSKNQDKPSLSQFYKSRERVVYDSSSGIPYQKLPPENVLSSAIRDSIRSQVQPVSLYQNLKDTNIDMARDAFESMTLDTSGEASKAIAGADRSDALSSAMLPEVVHTDGSVANKIAAPDALAQTRDAVPADLADFIQHDGLSQYLQSEKASARAWKVNQFQEAIGFTPRGEMFQLLPDMSKFTDNAQGFSFRGVYGPQNNGFKDAEQAVETAKFALRNTGIDESNLGLLKRDGGQYIPADLDAEKGKDGDYLVSIDHNYRIDAQDVDEAEGWQPLKVKLNFFDRGHLTDGRQGTLANTLLDQASMLDPVVVQSSVVGTDRAAAVEKSLLRQINDFAVSWKKLDKGHQQALLDEIHGANFSSRDYDYVGLTARGIPQEGIDTLKKFKTYWDGVWHLKNQYFTNQLRKAGYEEFVHVPSATNLPVRRVGKSAVSGGVNVYDAGTDTITHLKSSDIDTLYKNGGGIARLRQKILTQGGDTGEFVMYTNNPGTEYLRSFHANSQVLNYRPGYYGIDYKDPFHIVEKVKDAKGDVAYEKSVATAKDTKAAKLMVDRLNAQGPNEHYFRKDIRDSTERFESEFDINQAQGMSSFRRRGKLLEDSSSNITNLANTHVHNPIETMVSQAVPLSKKIAMQDVIDAQKKRAIAQWGQFLPKGDFGQPLIPNDIRKIKYRGGINQNQSDVADARTSFQYINYLEHNYTNLLDDGIKSTINHVADLFGKLGAPGKVEQYTRGIASKSLTRGLRSLSYYAFLGLSPLRQLLVQGHQAVMLAALNPGWVASKEAFAQPAYLALRTLGMDATHPTARVLAKGAWSDSTTAEKVFKQFQRTGLGAAVDHQNMISGAVNDVAANMVANSRNTLLSNVLSVPRSVAGMSRKIGFDSGEFYSSTMSWLAHRDLAQKQGLDVFSDDVADRVSGAARNYTGNMNSAGDLPSNRNALSLIFQYTQNTQKMLLNLSTNRGIPWQTKVAMGTLSLMLFGTGSQVFLSNHTLNSIQDPDARETVMNGLEGWFLNKGLSLASGGKSEIDWSGMSPFNAYGILDTLHVLTTSNLGDIVANTPAASMFFGSNPRVKNAMVDLMRYTHLIDDYQEPTTFLQVANDFAKISSGYSATMKAKYIMEVKKKVSSSGTVTDDNLDKVNAIGVALGFPTMDETISSWMANQNINQRNQVQSDVKEYYRQLKTHYLDEGLTGDQLLYTQKILNEFHRAYGDDEYAQRFFNSLVEQDLDKGDASLYNAMLRNCPLYNKGDCMNLLNAAPFKNEQDRESLKDLIQYGEQYKPSDYDKRN